jgi:hypothetical protein
MLAGGGEGAGNPRLPPATPYATARISRTFGTGGPPCSGAVAAKIARFVGQRRLRVTVDTDSHVMSDGQELDDEGMLR